MSSAAIFVWRFKGKLTESNIPMHTYKMICLDRDDHDAQDK